MATDRLTREARDHIIDRFTSLLNRLPASIPVPFTTDGDECLGEYANNKVPPDVRAAMDVLFAWDSDMKGNIMRYHRPRLVIFDDIIKQREVFIYNQYSDVPACFSLTALVPGDDRYDELFSYCHDHIIAEGQATNARSYLRHLLQTCATAGQVKRIMPECVRYMSESARNSLDGALRCSRWPTKVTLDHTKYQHALNALAKASLLPPHTPDSGAPDVRLGSHGRMVLEDKEKGAS